jgi:uncharacterized protein (DUF2164 family)
VAITLSRESDQRLRSSIQRFFAEHLDQEIGEMKAKLVLEYFLKEIAPSVYNQAVTDAQSWFQQRTVDLDGACYEKEFTFWSPETQRKPGARGG